MNNQTGDVAGRIVPFVICLLPGAEYEVALAEKDFYLPQSRKTLADLRDRAWTLSVSFVGRRPIVAESKGGFVPCNGVAEFGSKLPLWTGKSKIVIKN